MARKTKEEKAKEALDKIMAGRDSAMQSVPTEQGSWSPPGFEDTEITPEGEALVYAGDIPSPQVQSFPEYEEYKDTLRGRAMIAKMGDQNAFDYYVRTQDRSLMQDKKLTPAGASAYKKVGQMTVDAIDALGFGNDAPFADVTSTRDMAPEEIEEDEIASQQMKKYDPSIGDYVASSAASTIATPLQFAAGAQQIASGGDNKVAVAGSRPEQAMAKLAKEKEEKAKAIQEYKNQLLNKSAENEQQAAVKAGGAQQKLAMFNQTPVAGPISSFKDSQQEYVDATDEQTKAQQEQMRIESELQEAELAREAELQDTMIRNVEEKAKAQFAEQEAHKLINDEIAVKKKEYYDRSKFLDEYAPYSHSVDEETYRQMKEGLEVANNDPYVDDAHKAMMMAQMKKLKEVGDKRPVGAKIMAAIAMMFGGMLAGREGGPNQAIQIIQDQIDADIERQKMARGDTKKESQGLKRQWDLALETFGDDKAAATQVKINRYGELANYVEKLGYQAGSEMKTQQAASLAGDLRAKQQELGAEQEQNISGLGMKAAKTEFDMRAKNRQMEMQETVMFKKGAEGQAGKGKMLPAKALTDIADINAAMDITKQMEKAFADKAGFFSAIMQFAPASSAKSYNDWRLVATQTLGSKLEGGVLREPDFARYYDMLPSPADSIGRAKDKMAALKNLVTTKKKHMLETFGNAGYDVLAFLDPEEEKEEKTVTVKDKDNKIISGK